ncbi:hypothetical protein PVAG01_02136 [Phlyctema vagabunda]|uniref:Uncharacterized protein n=1 Tax=Phlyctema vagabunda TaxID=108571 RepID=A0ABR4PPY4_9HELO
MSIQQQETPLLAHPQAQSRDDKPKPKSFRRVLYTAQQKSGFKSAVNFYLFLLTAGVFGVFCLYRVRSTYHEFWLRHTVLHRFWYTDGFLGSWMSIHLKTVIPAGLMMPFQFLPVIRQRYPRFHRYSGRLNFVLLIIANISGFFVAPKAMGGSASIRIVIFFIAGFSLFSAFKSWIGIRNMRIDQHRAWVIRTWAYMGSILSLRIWIVPFMIATQILNTNVHKRVLECQEVLFLYSTRGLSLTEPLARYPVCANATMGGAPVDVIVTAALGPNVEQVYTMLGVCFGAAGWAGLMINALAVEAYLNYTRDEEERLKKVSEVRRKAAQAAATMARQ